MFAQFLNEITAGSLLMLAFAIYLNPRKVNIKANRWLSLLLLVTMFMFIGGLNAMEIVFNRLPILRGFDNYFFFTIAPILYLTIDKFVSPDTETKKKDWMHFIPFFLFLPLCILNSYISLKIKPIGQSITIPTHLLPNNLNTWLGFGLVFLIVIQCYVYLYFSYKKLLRHKNNILLFASSTEKIDLKWLQYLFITIGVMLTTWLTDALFFNNYLFHTWSNVIYLICVYIFAFYTYEQVEIFPYTKNEIAEINEVIEKNTSIKEVDKHKRLTGQQLNYHKSQLETLLESEKLFLDDSISLPKLAALLSMTPNDLSYLINEVYDENFFQFINKYRVKEAKKLILSDKYQHLNLLGIAYAAGFGSKSTFNTTFKKMTGQSPSEFQKKENNKK
jgi:AraC-like DNA-binding protein